MLSKLCAVCLCIKLCNFKRPHGNSERVSSGNFYPLPLSPSSLAVVFWCQVVKKRVFFLYWLGVRAGGKLWVVMEPVGSDAIAVAHSRFILERERKRSSLEVVLQGGTHSRRNYPFQTERERERERKRIWEILSQRMEKLTCFRERSSRRW